MGWCEFYFLGPNNRLLCEFAFGNGARGSISIYCRIPTGPKFVKDLWLSSLLREWCMENIWKMQNTNRMVPERGCFSGNFFLECHRSFASRDLHYPSSPRNWLRISLKSHWKRISWKLPCKSNQIHAKYPGETMLHHLDLGSWYDSCQKAWGFLTGGVKISWTPGSGVASGSNEGSHKIAVKSQKITLKQEDLMRLWPIFWEFFLWDKDTEFTAAWDGKPMAEGRLPAFSLMGSWMPSLILVVAWLKGNDWRNWRKMEKVETEADMFFFLSTVGWLVSSILVGSSWFILA